MWIKFAVVTLAIAAAASQGTKPDASKDEPLAYPTLEPFFGSKLQELVFGEVDKVDLDQVMAQLGKLDEISRQAKDEAEKVAPKTAGSSAALEPQPPAPDGSLCPILPLVMAKLQPLWESKSWTPEQVQLAGKAASIVARIADAPKLTFAAGKNDANRAELEKLVRWFDAQVAKPAYYAAMIFTMDDGPFAGFAYEAPEALATDRVLKLDEHLELRLAKVERPKEPWVLQCIRDGKPSWARVISAAPDESVRDVGFVDTPPSKLGSYGWQVHLHANWSYGDEHAPVYLDAKGGFLFYFLSW